MQKHCNLNVTHLQYMLLSLLLTFATEIKQMKNEQ